MPVQFALYGGKTDIGWTPPGRKEDELLEDFITINELGDSALIATIADGFGAMKDASFQAQKIVSNKVVQSVTRMYTKNSEVFLKNIKLFMEEFFINANDLLVAFKLGDDEKNRAMASTLTCCFITEDGICSVAHAGNTRLYLIRNGKVRQLTRDHTVGQDLVDKGIYSETEYYNSKECVMLTNGFGVAPTPTVQTFSFKLKPDDFIVMTTDGIHYNIRDDFFLRIIAESFAQVEKEKEEKEVLLSRYIDQALDNFISLAKDEHSFADHIGINILWYKPPGLVD